MSTYVDEHTPRPAPRRLLAPPSRLAGGSWESVALMLAIAAAAFGIRLATMVRNHGLFGLGNYDDGVYYGAAVGLVNGRMPYRDFLLLHPPGIVLALAPFAALGELVGDARGFALARLAWMLLGAVNAVLVYRILRPATIAGAVIGGFGYAVFTPAVYGEHTTLLEAPATTALLGAVLLLNGTAGRRRPAEAGPLIAAGLLLGLTVGFKVWGVVGVLLVLGWLLSTRRLKAAGWVAFGTAVAGAAVYLPFFAQAPGAMWRYTVMDQLHRSRFRSVSLASRAIQMMGLGRFGARHPSSVLLTGALIVCLAAAAVAWRNEHARLMIVLCLGLSGFLLLTPTWFGHYAALTAAPLMVVIGAAGGELLRSLERSRGTTAVAVLLFASLMIFYALPTVNRSWARGFPASALTASVAAVPGCITADDVTGLIELNVLSRNLRRGCPLSVDLGGANYDVQPTTAGADRPRRSNPAWQRVALRYLGSGTEVLLVRAGLHSLSRRTVAIVGGWRLLERARHVLLRAPQH
ncbi:hypothetical protein GCM10009841_11450 [Microlunatus panaciterrae]|uniref:Dolichyl-phosphate-mannose-protein mannosyltransferase n=1 Tax=Microlunatus panaciterrae TaxID=400768 RepID=A0ABS2RL25_9ACTN|nr:glycosyltransferase 87 family protein [Microlunatus panaciterrae]MBM7799701.1 hypothetical protein [Microlunatus panaciterrae]